jgi:O-antigen ligase
VTVEFSGEEPIADLLFSRGGLSWFGGLIGGVGTGLWMLRRRRVPLIPALAAATPALAGWCHRAHRMRHGWRRRRPAERSALGRRVS